MITQDDIQFHVPEDIPYDWAETLFLDVYVPEAKLFGIVYFVFRAGIGAVACDVTFFDGRSALAHDARYIDAQQHLPLPERMDRFELPNGVRVHVTSPTEYRVDYEGVDGTEVHLDYAGVTVPYDIHDPELDPLAKPPETVGRTSGFGNAYANHFDLTTRCTGHLVVRGERHDVDCFATIDHSWGPRPERGMKAMGWVNAHFEDVQMHGIYALHPETPERENAFAHGFAVVDGELRGGTGGTMRFDDRDDGLLPTSFEMSVTDRTGVEHRATGRAVATHLWYANACCPTTVAMVEWTDARGRTGIGVAMETLPLDTYTGGALPWRHAAAR